MMKKRSVRLNSKGFTLVELLVVIAILALLAGIGVPQVMRTLQRSREVADLTAIETVQSAVDAFRSEVGIKNVTDVPLGAKITDADADITLGVALTTDGSLNKGACGKSLITGYLVKLEDLLEGKTLPTLKSISGFSATADWHINNNGQVYVDGSGTNNLPLGVTDWVVTP